MIDERGTDFTVNEPIGSLTVTSSGDRSSVYGYQDIDHFVLKPYADNVDSWVMGDIEHVQTTDNWYADLVIGGDVGRADLEQFDYSDLAVYGNVDHLDLTIAHGDVMIEGDEVADSSIQTGDGHDYLYLEEVTGTTIHTGAGHDDVALEDADQVAVHTGEGNDSLSFTTADPTVQLAYNLGEGHDFAYIAGGNTLGVTLDGDNDTIVFNTEAGGNHEVMVDEHDQFYLQTETGLWDANLVDFIDVGGQDGMAELGDFSLTMITGSTPPTDDLFLG